MIGVGYVLFVDGWTRVSSALCCVVLRDAACILCCTRFQVMYVVKEEGGEMRTYDKHEEGEGAPSRKRVTQEDSVLRCVTLRCVVLRCVVLLASASHIPMHPLEVGYFTAPLLSSYVDPISYQLCPTLRRNNGMFTFTTALHPLPRPISTSLLSPVSLYSYIYILYSSPYM